MEFIKPESSSKQKIKEAALKVFIAKGYARAGTRDIIKEAGIKTSLNYHYRSKGKLFELILKEQMNDLFSLAIPFISDRKTSLEEKISSLLDYYLLILENDSPLMLFLLSELQSNPMKFFAHLRSNNLFRKTVLDEQICSVDMDSLEAILILMSVLIEPFVDVLILKGTLFSNNKLLIGFNKARKEDLLELLLKIFAG